MSRMVRLQGAWEFVTHAGAMIEQIFNRKNRKWIVFDGDYVIEQKSISLDSGISIENCKNLLDSHAHGLINPTINFDIDHMSGSYTYNESCEYSCVFSISGLRLPTEEELVLRERDREEKAKLVEQQTAATAKQQAKLKAAKEAHEKKEYERLRKKFEAKIK